jgi:pyridoxal 5'-phosphate synthase pdxS subunit
MPEEELMSAARDFQAPYELVLEVHKNGKLPVVNFSAGGIATPSDAALMMQIGVEGVFVGSGIFKSSNPPKMAEAIVKATTHYNDPDMLAEISAGLGDAMPGIEANKISEKDQLQTRGW